MALLGLTVWSLLQVWRNYPAEFFPRFGDEGIYALDARVPGSIFDAYKPGVLRYAPAKLGYGIPLAASVSLAGTNGPMYLSTLLWLATIIAVAVLTWRILGVMASVTSVALLSSSALFGKYVADVGPTSEVALAFVLLWGASCTRKSWLVGLAVGAIAFIDFKWAVPVGVSYVLIEALLETKDAVAIRVRRIATVAIFSLGAIGAAMIIHRPYVDFFVNYVFPHSEHVAFEPSAIAVYYWFVFGALAPILATVMLLIVPEVRRVTTALEKRTSLPLGRALILFAVPVVYYSLIGELKAARFFAAPYPLLVIVVGGVFSAALSVVRDRLSSILPGRPVARTVVACAFALCGLAVIHGGSAGPGSHLALPSGYPEVLNRIGKTATRGTTISTYNWAVVAYGWTLPFTQGSFAYLGLQNTDKWIALDPIHDRATIGLRIGLSGTGASADSTWAYQREVYRSVSDSLFSVRSDFHASDCFLSELVTDGIPTFRRWRNNRADSNWMSVYEVNPTKLGDGWKQ